MVISKTGVEPIVVVKHDDLNLNVLLCFQLNLLEFLGYACLVESY